MLKRDTFQLDITGAGRVILQDLAVDVVQKSGEAILARASSMNAALGGRATYKTTSRVGTIRKGSRAITTVQINDTGDARQNYLAREALVRAKDAGRV